MKIKKLISLRPALLFVLFSLAFGNLFAQNESEKPGQKKIKIVTVEDDGSTSTIEKMVDADADLSEFFPENIHAPSDQEDAVISHDEEIEIGGPEGKKVVKTVKIKKNDDGTATKHVLTLENGEVVEDSETPMTAEELAELEKMHGAYPENSPGPKEGEKVIVKDLNVQVWQEEGEDQPRIVVKKRMVFIGLEDLSREDIAQLRKGNSAGGNSIANSADKPSLEVKEITLFPNPNSGKFELMATVPNSKKAVTLTVLDAQGKEILREEVEATNGQLKKELDLSQNAKGIYYLGISQGGKQIMKKIVIQ